MYKRQVQVDPSYNFANFVTEYLAEEFSHVVRLEFLMWIIAIVWIAFPAQAYAGTLRPLGHMRVQLCTTAFCMHNISRPWASHARQMVPDSPVCSMYASDALHKC